MKCVDKVLMLNNKTAIPLNFKIRILCHITGVLHIFYKNEFIFLI